MSIYNLSVPLGKARHGIVLIYGTSHSSSAALNQQQIGRLLGSMYYYKLYFYCKTYLIENDK